VKSGSREASTIDAVDGSNAERAIRESDLGARGDDTDAVETERLDCEGGLDDASEARRNQLADGVSEDSARRTASAADASAFELDARGRAVLRPDESVAASATTYEVAGARCEANDDAQEFVGAADSATAVSASAARREHAMGWDQIVGAAIEGLDASEPKAEIEASEMLVDALEAEPEAGWAGLRARLEERGTSFTASLWLDAHRVASGGLERGNVVNSFFDATATFDLDALCGVPNALVVLDAYAVNGRDVSELAGDAQVLSNTANDRHAEQLAQLYYEQSVLDGALRFKLGKADVNVDFAAVENGGEFIQSSAGFSPTIFALPTYPEPSCGGALFWQPAEHLSLGIGVFDGAANAGFHTGSRGPSTLFGAPSDLFSIAEGGATWSLGELAGRVALGAWHHNGDFERFDGGSESGTGGSYALCEQELARWNDSSVASFVQWGDADSGIAEIDGHVALGCIWTGLGERTDDALGVYWTRAHFASGLGTSAANETAVELLYRCQTCDWLVLKPDLQVIANPGGDDSLDDAWVLTLRAQLDF
jgi:porin